MQSSCPLTHIHTPITVPEDLSPAGVKGSESTKTLRKFLQITIKTGVITLCMCVEVELVGHLLMVSHLKATV